MLSVTEVSTGLVIRAGVWDAGKGCQTVEQVGGVSSVMGVHTHLVCDSANSTEGMCCPTGEEGRSRKASWKG